MNVGPHFADIDAHAKVGLAVDPAVGRAVGPAVDPIRAEKPSIPHPNTVCADCVLPTYLRHLEVGA